MIPEDIRESINLELSRIERDDECIVLLAVESGSRAWGFASPDSDYDARFIYIRRPEWYLSIDLEHRRDVIERPITDLLDISGWDIRKALTLFAKSNPPLLEWLGSPIVYSEQAGFVERMRSMMPEYYSSVRSFYHYLHMATGNNRTHLQGEIVPLKKYLYVLRPLLALRWIEQKRGVVPMEFARLLVTIQEDPRLCADIDELLEQKMRSAEVARGAAIPSISGFITEEIGRLEQIRQERAESTPGVEPLNRVFRDLLEHSWNRDA